MAEELILLFVTVNIFTENRGQIAWKLYTKPAVFGKDVQLACQLTSGDPCCSEYTRKWAKGWKYNLTIINGVSLNSLKYLEYLNSSASISILTIRSFNENDVDIPYECTYGFNTFSKVLKITERDFEYHPLEELPINITIYKSYVEVNITFEKVYPSPECNAKDGVNNLEQNLTITTVENGLFYTSNIYLIYDISEGCQRTIVVKCTVGRSSFTIVNNTVPAVNVISEKSIQVYFPYAVTAAGGAVVVIFIIACILRRYLKCCHCECNFWRRTNNGYCREEENKSTINEELLANTNDQPRVSPSTSVFQTKETEI